MHNAPAVSFPVGRSRFYGLGLAVAGLLGAGFSVYWIVTSPQLSHWRAALAGCCVAATWLFAWWSWLHSPKGTLRWSGEQWEFAPSRPGSLVYGGDLAVHLDLQFLMLVMLRPHNVMPRELPGNPVAQRRFGFWLDAKWYGLDAKWYWLDAKAQPGQWLAVRRAAHARIWQPKVAV